MSNETNETIADIVASKRSEAQYIRENNDTLIGRKDALKLEEEADRIEVVYKREVAELRKCLNEAIREKCPFTRMSCKHGEPCDYECGTDKWRKALQDEGGAE